MKQEELWDALYSGNPATWRGNTVIPVPNSGEALDLGCGNGKTVSTLLDAGYAVTGIDFSSVAIEQCKDRFIGSEFYIGTICDMPFDDSSFDYITAVHVLEHLDDESLERAVSEIRRILKPSGFVFVRCFTERDMRSDKRKESEIFYRFYDVDSIRDAFDGFQIMSSEIKEDKTRFGTLRSRVEVLLKL